MFRQLFNIFKREQTSVNIPDSTNPFQTIQCQANDPSEDRISFGFIDQISAHYLAVFDGHGGSKVSQYLQDNIHNTITSVIKNRSKVVRDNETLIKISLHNIFECLEQNLLQIMNNQSCQKSSKFEECGSCALLAIVTKTHIFIANSGDSQGIIINSNLRNDKVTNTQQNTKQISQIQRLKNKFPNDQNLFRVKNNIHYIKGKLMPTSTIGDFSLKYKSPNKKMLEPLKMSYIDYKPQISVFPIFDQDNFLLLASDGLWDLLSPSQLHELISSTSKSTCLQAIKYKCYQKSALNSSITKQQLMRIKNKREYIDDISIVLLDLSLIK